MKKKFILLFILLIIILVEISMSYVQKNSNKVLLNGALKVEGTTLKNRFGKPIQLKGVSSHGLQWEDNQLLNEQNLKALVDEWGINVFRVAIYTEEGGYIENLQEMKSKAINLIDMCIDLNIYVVIDWHILSDGDPNIYKTQAMEFFDEMSKKYQDIPNVIYEICNEPNGDNVSWDRTIAPYAKDVIETIRENSKKSIIIVGTPGWSKEVIAAANKPLEYNNIMYSFHFYSGTHGERYRKNVQFALDKGLPIFVSEWGTTSADGNGGFFENESNVWINFLNERNISWINWSFSNKDETSAIIEKGSNNIFDLTETGRYIKSVIDSRVK